MAVANTLVTVYDLNAAGYVRGANQVKAATASTIPVLARAKAAMGASSWKSSDFKSVASGLAQGARMVATAFAAVTGGLLGMGLAAAKQGAEFESLILALKATEGSASGAEAAMRRLKDIAKLPGLGFTEGIEAYLGLRQTGATAGQADRIIRAFGNANAFNAGGKEEFSRIGLAIRQMMTKPYLQGQELMQLSEARLPAYKILKDAFGTSDTEELKRRGVTSGMAIAALVTQLEKLPRVAGGAKNAFDNVSDALMVAVSQVGMGLNRKLTPFLDRLASALGRLSDAGVLGGLGATIANVLSANNPALGSAEDALIEFGGAIIYTTGVVKGLAQGMAWLIDKMPFVRLAKALTANGDANSPADVAERWKANARAMLARPRTTKGGMDLLFGKDGAASLAGLGGGEGAAPVMPRLVTALEENTRSLEEQTASMNRMVFGGGELGQYGVTPVEIGQASRRKGGNTLNITVLGGANEIYDVLTRLERQGRI